MQTNYRGLAFLLSIGSLPLACNPKETNETEGDDSTTTASTTPSGTTGTDATDPTQASDPTSASGTSTSGTPTTGEPTTGQSTITTSPSDTSTTEPQDPTFLTSESETADTGEDTGPPPASDPACLAYAAHIVECIPRYADYQEYIAQNCEYTKMYARTDGADCLQAIDAFYVCISMVDCAELMKEEPTACPKEQAVAEMACPSLSEPGDTDTDSGDPDSTSG
jgi:hypothetical protein